MGFRLVFFAACRIILKSRFFTLAFFTFCIMALAVLMAAQFSGRQPSTVALDVGLSALRLSMPLLIILQVQELISREFERRFYLSSITYPIPRHYWLLGRFLALITLISALLITLSLALAAMVLWIGHDYSQSTPVSLGLPYWITVGFIAVDLVVLTSMAVLLAVVASTPSFVLIGTFGFMLIARSFAAINALLESKEGLVENTEGYLYGLHTLGYFIPDLGSLDVRAIALYGQLSLLPSDWPLSLLAAFVYALGLLGLSVWIIQRRVFA